MTSNDIRKSFLNFFISKRHKIEKYAPLLLKNDSTLMFVNSGMVQFKDIFLGNIEPRDNRVANFQKCLRVSGKHNDLEDVGKDTYHHTLFEMFGNWSFGDYFKKEAIEWSWEFLTKICGIDKEDLYVTIFEGDKEEGLDVDNESYEIWKEVIDKDRILKFNKRDNFWEMGSQGPCGPCSEIHVDIRSEREKREIDGKSLVNKDHPQVIEIWNLVFIQYNRKADGKLENLPQKHVDTGMGFERLCSVLQNKKSNYDTDLFLPIIGVIEDISGEKYNSKDEKINIAMRVISDHIKAISFAISEGIIPSNNAEGYVIRRILRRAVRYGYSFLGLKEPFLYKLYPALRSIYGEFYREIETQEKFVQKVIKQEEISFFRTLESGLKKIDYLVKNREHIKGDKIFELYDTYGFPFDLTSLILSENNINVDKEGFEIEMQKQKNRSKKSSEVKLSEWIVTNSENITTKFTGYDNLVEDVRILKYRNVEIKGEKKYQIILDKTPFYPEGGGQIGDSGVIKNSVGETMRIIDTKKENETIIHISENVFKNLNEKFVAEVDKNKRNLCEAHHSSTHLLHYSLTEILGNHVKQRGAFVSDEHLRFDFSHFSKIDSETLHRIENKVNSLIESGLELEEKRDVDYDDAIKDGVLALFGEKYKDRVRSIKFGNSYELCGGTHVKNTNKIRYFKIISESSVSSGIRRIEAIASKKALNFVDQSLGELNDVKREFNNSKNVIKDILKLKSENIGLKKIVEQLEKEKINVLKSKLKNKIENIDGINFISERVSIEGKYIKDICFELGNEIGNLVLALGSDFGDKVNISIYISKELVSKNKLNANDIIKEIADLVDGKGGGQPFFAVLGGDRIEGIDLALEKVKKILS